MSIYIGIDPGKDGALSVIEGDFKRVYLTPKMGKEYDLNEMFALVQDISRFKDIKINACLENINSHSCPGRQAVFVMGKGVAYWEMALVANGVPYHMPTPATWQKVAWQGIPIQYKAPVDGKKKKDTKNTSMVAAKRLFPDVDFRKSARCKNMHDGKVDSMLIAEYCRQKFS